MNDHYWRLENNSRFTDQWTCVECGLRWTTQAIRVLLPDGRTFLAKKPPEGYVVTSDIEQSPVQEQVTA